MVPTELVYFHAISDHMHEHRRCTLNACACDRFIVQNLGRTVRWSVIGIEVGFDCTLDSPAQDISLKKNPASTAPPTRCYVTTGRERHSSIEYLLRAARSIVHPEYV